MSTATTTRPTFTELTWKAQGRLTRKNAPRTWTGLHDLAIEAVELAGPDSRLTFEHWRELVSAVAAGLPITLVHEHRLTGSDRIERVTRTYVVDELEPNPRVWGAVRGRTWGFTINLALSDLVEVIVPDTSYEYRTEA